MGYKPDFGQFPEPVQVAAFLKDMENKRVGPALSQLLLKSLMQARYSPEAKEHFGLATDRYLHFTSPIRRYPDLLVHRQLGELLNMVGARGLDIHSVHLPVVKWPLEMDRVQGLADSCSKAERKALAAERAVASLYQAAWARDRLGEQFHGLVSYVSEIGLFVQLRPSMVEGLVHVSRLGDDYYDYDPDRFVLLGRRSGSSFRVGDAVRVSIASANLANRRVDLDLV